ncbi:APO protein [Quillaja saponaria]|uniref:APO protein n=1 Tax=Quillaja saponaria TaxID=32244 RepID=A0AAD7LKJ9_QUISA|nr:APO protein [Quillaja saponaria]
MGTRVISDIYLLKRLHCRLNRNLFFSSERTLTLRGDTYDPMYSDIPKPPSKKSERKPYPTPMKVLIQRAKEEREVRKAQPVRMLEEPPDNGLLVPELVEVARRVYQARGSLLFGLSKLVQVIPVQRCRFCNEVHIGHVGHEIRTCTGPESGFRSATHVWRTGGVQDVISFPKCFHLYDRVGKPRVGHDERYTVPRIPAIVELCIQAGLDLAKFPTKRRTKPVFSIEGRIVDFESVAGKEETERSKSCENVGSTVDSSVWIKPKENTKNSGLEDGIRYLDQSSDEERNTIRELSIQTLDSWFEMALGAKKIMEKYIVNTCGYCPEIQVGPKGHKVRKCKASKHQSRDGLHAWQEATIDDLVGPNYVWHVQDLSRSSLVNNLKRYYGKAPAVVELCVHAGAPIPDQYRSLMRLDVVPPDRDEVDLVA